MFLLVDADDDLNFEGMGPALYTPFSPPLSYLLYSQGYDLNIFTLSSHKSLNLNLWSWIVSAISL